MFKDYDKYLSTSLKVYLFVLIIIFIMKMVGLDYFGLDVNNPIILAINNFCLKWKFEIVYSYIICFVTSYITVSLTIKDNSKKLFKFMIITFPITILVKYSGYILNNALYFIVQFIYLLILILIYNKRINKNTIKSYIIVYIVQATLQAISMFFRAKSFDYVNYSFIISFLLNIDYLLMLIIYYKLFFMKGGIKCYQEAEVGFSSLKKINLKKSLKKLQKNLHNFSEKEKVEKLSIIIYFILSAFWNLLTIVIILLVAKINDTFIECIFIITSFWLSKGKFGKAFHLKSMIQCFVVSNLSYYILNRITTPLGISIIVPILLGVGLSYLTSKLVKKEYKPLYRGMPEELFNETILKVTDKDSEKYNVCYDFYIKKKSTISLAIKYNYSEAGIRKIKDRINNKIKEL